MSKNKLTDLNNHLFMQLERLANEDLSGEQIEQEVKRTEAIVSISQQVIDNAELHLRAAKLVAEHGAVANNLLPMIGAEKPAATSMAGITFKDKDEA